MSPMVLVATLIKALGGGWTPSEKVRLDNLLLGRRRCRARRAALRVLAATFRSADGVHRDNVERGEYAAQRTDPLRPSGPVAMIRQEPEIKEPSR